MYIINHFSTVSGHVKSVITSSTLSSMDPDIVVRPAARPHRHCLARTYCPWESNTIFKTGLYAT